MESTNLIERFKQRSTIGKNFNLNIPVAKSSTTVTSSPRKGFAEQDLATIIQIYRK
jgi:hypothetical protein